MKEIEIKETKVIKKYQAEDGTIFNSMSECTTYEQTAHAALYAAYKTHVVRTASEYSIFDTGSEEYVFDFVKLETTQDVSQVLAFLELYKCGGTKAANILNKALQSGELLLIGYCEYDKDNFSIIGTREEIINRVKKELYFEDNENKSN